jgi:hypothetical protein
MLTGYIYVSLFGVAPNKISIKKCPYSIQEVLTLGINLVLRVQTRTVLCEYNLHIKYTGRVDIRAVAVINLVSVGGPV